MFKPELLSPAGSQESVYAAVNNGADAVYLGGKQFGARQFADNFSNTELEEIIDDKKKDRDAELLKEANENHEKAGEYMRKISRNRQLANAYKSNAGVWISFNTIGFARGKEE